MCTGILDPIHRETTICCRWGQTAKKATMTLGIGSSEGAGGGRRGARERRFSHAPRPTPHAPAHGFTLIEILVSVAILASAIVLIMQAFARGAYALNLSSNRLRAYAFAASKMADLELSVRQGVEPKPDGQFRIGQDRFQWQVSATPIPDEPALKLVTLTVEWAQGKRSYTSQTSLVTRAPAAQPES